MCCIFLRKIGFHVLKPLFLIEFPKMKKKLDKKKKPMTVIGLQKKSNRIFVRLFYEEKDFQLNTKSIEI